MKYSVVAILPLQLDICQIMHTKMLLICNTSYLISSKRCFVLLGIQKQIKIWKWAPNLIFNEKIKGWIFLNISTRLLLIALLIRKVSLGIQNIFITKSNFIEYKISFSIICHRKIWTQLLVSRLVLTIEILSYMFKRKLSIIRCNGCLTLL